MDVTFPHGVSRQSSTFARAGLSQEPKTAITGAQTVVPTQGGHWTATVSLLLRGEAQELAWMAFLAQMEGRIGVTQVPVNYAWRPRDRDGHVVSFCKVAPLSGAQTAEHFGFASVPMVTVTLGGGALRATEMDYSRNNVDALRPGHYFSVGERLHQVQLTWRDRNGVDRMRFWPPLRRAVEAGETATLDRPVCRMRFATEDEGLLPADFNRLPIVTCNFIEAL